MMDLKAKARSIVTAYRIEAANPDVQDVFDSIRSGTMSAEDLSMLVERIIDEQHDSTVSDFNAETY